MTDPDFLAAVRRIAAYGAITRMTGFDYLVELTGQGRDAELVVNEGDEVLVLRRDAELAGVLTADWSSDAAASRVVCDWLEEYLEDMQQYLVIRRDYIDDLVSDPYNELYLDRLIDRFPTADRSLVEQFLSEIAQWLAAD